jgi:excisionase family DNA binding protein
MNEWITTSDAADLSGYHTNHIRRLIRVGAIDAKKFGPIWQVNRESLLLYIESVKAKGDKRGPRPGGNQ